MAKDQGFGRRPAEDAKQHAEPTLSFATRARDGEPRGPRLGSERDMRGRTKNEKLTADADRPLYLSRDASEERSSRAWIGIAVLAVAAGLGFYGWRLYTAPVTVEPMPVASTPSNTPADASSSATPSLAATPPADTTNPGAPPSVTPPPAQALSSVGQVATPNAADNAAATPPATQPFSINSPATAASAPPPKPASPPVKAAEAKPDTSDTAPPRKEASLDIAPPKPPRALPDTDKGLAPIKLSPPKPAMLTPPPSAMPQPAQSQPDLTQPDLAEPALPTPAPSVATATTAPRSFDNGSAATGRPLPLSRTSLPADNTAPALRPPSAMTPPANDNAPAAQAPSLAGPASLPAMAAPPAADQPNTVTVDGVTYVNGQQPHALGTLSSSEPPAASDASGATPAPLPTIDVPSSSRAVPYTPPSDASTPLPNDIVIAPNGQMSVPAGQQ